MTGILVDTLAPPTIAIILSVDVSITSQVVREQTHHSQHIDVRSLRVFHGSNQKFQFFLHQIASSIVFHVFRNTSRRGVSTVCGTKRIHNKVVREFAQASRKFGIVLGLSLVKASVFQQENFSAFHGTSSSLHLRSHAVIHLGHMGAEKFLQGFDDRGQSTVLSSFDDFAYVGPYDINKECMMSV